MSLPAAFLHAPIAHRGLHDPAAGRVENSLSAVRAAMGAGYGIELDLQLSADGQAMVFHDATLDRLTQATGPVRAQTAAALRRMRLRGGADTIPTLAGLCDAVAGRAPLLIELKDQGGAPGPGDGALEAATAQVLAGYDGPVAVMSFNPHMMVTMAALLPQVPRGLVTWAVDGPEAVALPADARAALRDMALYDAAGACFVSHDARDLDSPALARIRARGGAVLCWTVTSPEAEARARRVADNITFEGYLPEIAPQRLRARP